MKYFSMFSGIGGFELGIRKAVEDATTKDELCDRFKLLEGNDSRDVLQKIQTATCVGFSEIDKYAIQIYKKHFGEHKNYGSATNIISKKLPDFDLLVGGFPCQSFSIAGKRGGFQDTRGTLFFEITRILKDKRPRYLLLENVKGLLSHESGKTFQTILKILSDIGYILQWEVLNSKNYGVPQNRERVFIVGHLRGTSRPDVFPIGKSNEKLDEKITQGNDIAHTITNSEKLRGSYIIHNVYGGFKEDKVREFRDYSPTIRTPKGGGHIPLVKAVLTPDRAEKRQNGRRMKDDGEPSFTLTGQDVHGVAYKDVIRRLTPTECERLQGFPDGWTNGISDTQRYKCLGNAVTVNVVEEIIKRFNF